MMEIVNTIEIELGTPNHKQKIIGILVFSRSEDTFEDGFHAFAFPKYLGWMKTTQEDEIVFSGETLRAHLEQDGGIPIDIEHFSLSSLRYWHSLLIDELLEQERN